MAENKTKKFNLLQYVYGRLFAEQCLKDKAEGKIIEETGKIYSWKGILYWLQKEKYISDIKVVNVNASRSALTYSFNRKKIIYWYYVKAIERKLKMHQLEVIPANEIFEGEKAC